MKLSKEHIERLREMLARPGQRIVVVSHTNPDGDADGYTDGHADSDARMGRGPAYDGTCGDLRRAQ